MREKEEPKVGMNGTGFRFVDSWDAGDTLVVEVAVAPTGSYPALGEPIATILADPLLGSNIKVVAGVVPNNAVVGNDNLGHVWSFDPAQGTMGTLRNWTAVGATPTEHATGGYGGNEANAVFRVTFFFPKFRTTSA